MAVASLIISIFSFVVASIAAVISGYQLYTAKDQEVRQLRAYVGSVSLQVVKNDNPNHLFLRILWHNFGSTPALKFGYSWHTHTEFRAASAVYPNSERDIYDGQGVTIFPNSDSNWNTDFVVTEFPEDFTANRRIVTFYGTAFYQDVFGGLRSTSFCYIISHDSLSSLSKVAVYPDNCNNTSLVN